MMFGNVVNLHAVLNITFRLANGYSRELEFVIDTGFTGFLTLPPEEVASLGLQYLFHIPAYLTDHSEIRLPVYRGVIDWNGSELDVNVLATGQRPLLGTALLGGYELVAQFSEMGQVTIEEL
ncbi:MAG: clan AA aspartic protease [Armatimonadota bacterium]|nr:clan AA aspartic protease [Armatimonadota bacterium]